MCRMEPSMSARVSPVLMLRGVPTNTTPRELEQFARRYSHDGAGVAMPTSSVKTLVVPKKRIAFIQMGSRDEAAAVMWACKQASKGVCIEKDGRRYPVDVQYSEKDEIKATPRPKNQVTSAEEGCRVLLVVLAELQHLIQLSEIFWIFSQFGTVEKLSSFTRDRKNQVLVQMATRHEADLAMAYLNGKLVPLATADGLSQCRFSIVPSKLPYLTFKREDKKNRDYDAHNALLAGDYAKFAELNGNDEAAAQPWIATLAHLPLPERLATINECEGGKFFRKHKAFVWGEDVSGTGAGVLVPPQDDPRQYGTIPTPSPARTGIPAGQLGDCVHVSRIGSTTAAQLWNVMVVYGDVVAAKLLWKYPGTALVQFRNRKDAQNAMKHLNGTAVSPEGDRWCVRESSNPNAMHWSGANTELDERMISVMSAEAPMVHPTKVSTKPSANVLVWTARGLPRGMADTVYDVVRSTLRESPRFAPQELVDVEGRVGYSVMMPSVDLAVGLVAYLNGAPAAQFPEVYRYAAAHPEATLLGARLGALFISDAEAEAAFEDAQGAVCEGLGDRSETCGLGRQLTDADSDFPRSCTLP